MKTAIGHGGLGDLKRLGMLGSCVALSLFTLTSCQSSDSSSENTTEIASKPQVLLPAQKPGVLYLDTPALPDTVATEQPEWSYFAWNTFVAMNWPALEQQPDKFRGIPDLGKSFVNASNDDLTVWESFKEKRELFNHPNSASSLSWYSPVNYGLLRLGDQSLTQNNFRTFHDASGTTAHPDAFDETVEVQSQSLEPLLPDGSPNPITNSHFPVVTARVWKGQPKDTGSEPIVYEVKVNYDYFKYTVDNGFNTNNTYQNNPVNDTALRAGINLPYRTSSSKTPTGGTRPVVNYRADNAVLDYGANNLIYESNKMLGTDYPAYPPSPVGSVQVKAAWVKLADSSGKASDFPTWHTAKAIQYETSGGAVTAAPEALYGLVGMHIIQRIHTSDTANLDQNANFEGGTFIFSTWEHSSIFNSPAMGSIGTSEYYYSNYFGGAPFESGNKPGFYPKITGDIYPVQRKFDILENVKTVNTDVHNQIRARNSSSVWLNYHLVGTQFKAISVNDMSSGTPKYTVSENDPTGIGQPVFLSNLAIETNLGLQFFRGQPPTIAVIDQYSENPTAGQIIAPNTSLQFVHSANNMAFNKKGKNMGGCMGCHGVAQSLGFAFSFVMLDGYLGAVTDTQKNFDQPGANPMHRQAPPNTIEVISPQVITSQSNAAAVCPNVCNSMSWDNNYQNLGPNQKDAYYCFTTSNFAIPVGYIKDKTAASTTCPAQISQIKWNNSYSTVGTSTFCGCSIPAPIPKPAT